MKQNTYGDGTLYHRKDDRWEYKVKIGDKANGDPDYKSFYSRDKTGRKAKEQYRQWLQEKEAEKIETVQTVERWAATWLNDYRKGKGSAGNYKNYELYVNKHILPHIGKLYMGDVRQVHIERLYSAEKGLSNSGLNYIKICLHGIFKSGRKNHLCLDDPTEDVTPPWHDKKMPEYYTKAEVAIIKRYAAADPDGYLALGLLYTGCRISELCALTWGDYNDGILCICKAATRSDETGMKYSISDTTKSKKPRDVVLNPEGQAFFDDLPHGSLYIFSSQKSFLSPEMYRRHYYRFLDRINTPPENATEAQRKKYPLVRKLSPHKCRHTYGTMLLNSCHNIRTVQDQLGHARISTTEIYTHTDLTSRKADVRKLKY
jgi:integrase